MHEVQGGRVKYIAIIHDKKLKADSRPFGTKKAAEGWAKDMCDAVGLDSKTVDIKCKKIK